MIEIEEKELFWDRDALTRASITPFIEHGGVNDIAFMMNITIGMADK